MVTPYRQRHLPVHRHRALYHGEEPEHRLIGERAYDSDPLDAALG